MTTKSPSEARIQEDAFKLLRKKYPQAYGCLYHIANGGARDRISATFLTAQGVVPGVQDLHLIWQGRLYLIEVKTPTGSVSHEQKVIHAQHDIQGFKTYILKSTDEIVGFVSAVIEGGSVDHFDYAISPYSDGSKYEQYLSELKIELQRRAEEKANRFRRKVA